MKNIYTRINAIQKDISNRINVIDLSEHEVNLGLAEDMIKNYDIVTLSLNNLEKKLDEILSAENRAGDIRNELLKQYTQFNKVEDEIKKSFKELGLDYNTSKYGPTNQKVRERMQSVMNLYSKVISKI
jgi:hypothetical protein